MPTVTISPRFQVVIPKAVREALALQPGAKLRISLLGSRIELIPVRPIRDMRGLLRGIDTSLERDPDRL